MLLSINAAKPPDEGDISARPSPPASTKLTSKQPKQVLYSKVHQRPAKLHESLLHVSNSRSLPFSNSSSTDPADAQPVIIDTVYWGASQTPGSIFFDVTTRKESDRELYKLSFYQLQDFVGQLVHKSGSNRYLEINFDNNDAKQNACNNGLKFDNGHFVIRPAIALAPGSIVKRVNLHRLPWLRPKELLDGLKATLGNYGVVRDVGVVNIVIFYTISVVLK